MQGLDLIPLRIPVLIWLPDGPLGARRCAVGLGETDRVRSDHDDDDVKDDLVRMIIFVSCSFFCLVVLVLVVIAVMYGQTIISSIQFCESSYFKRIDFRTLVSTSHPVPQNPTQPPVFIAPAIEKCGFNT